MIKKIHTIRKIGVFQDYRRNGDLRDFDDKNIIYGWNYSGKTTLSRLISFLDKESDKSEQSHVLTCPCKSI